MCCCLLVGTIRNLEVVQFGEGAFFRRRRFPLFYIGTHYIEKSKKKNELKCHIHFKITFEESCFLVIWYSRDQSYFSVLRKKTWKTKHFPWQVNVPTQMLRQQVPHKVKYHWIKAFSFLLLPFCPHTYSQILISKHLHILCTRFVFLLFPLWRVTLKVPQYNKLFSLKRKKKNKQKNTLLQLLLLLIWYFQLSLSFLQSI